MLIPYITQEPEVVLPGTGDRTLSLAKEEEMAIGMPAKLISYVNENLFKAGQKLNMGQPTKFFVGSIPEGFGPPAWNYLKRKMKKQSKEEGGDE